MLYPLRFREVLRNYGFGGRWIPRVFAKRGLPKNHRLAETWEVCDRPNGESSVVINGPLRGKSLRQLIKRYNTALLGGEITGWFGNKFPLLIKFLDCTYALGEQAHQSDELARKQGLLDPGKTEAWYMLKTRPGATLHCGNKKGVTHQKLYKALLKGISRSCMKEHIAKPGRAFLLYAGTMHYSKGGLLFYEIMQNSDAYINLGKLSPDLSLDQKEKAAQKALEGVHLENNFDCAARPVVFQDQNARRSIIMACTHFALERLDLQNSYRLNCGGKKFFVLSLIAGAAQIKAGKTTVSLKPGNTCLLPANLGAVTIKPQNKAALLKAYVPDLKTDIVKLLRQKGIKDRAIEALGGRTKLNPLKKLLQ